MGRELPDIKLELLGIFSKIVFFKDNSFNISGEHRYFFHFEDGLDAEAYLFTFVAEDEEGNNSVRKTSISVV